MQTAQWQAVYLHGKGGNAREAEHYRALLPGWRVTGLDYRAQTPWEAREEFLAYFKAARRDGTKVLVIANSIGAFFAMQALDETRVDRALFVSPVVDMERLIETMMAGEGITEPELRQRGEIKTEFGETLSWRYLQDVRQRRRPHAPRNGGSLCPAHRRGPNRNGGRRALVPHKSADAVSGCMGPGQHRGSCRGTGRTKEDGLK